MKEKGTLLEIAGVFFRLGCFAFGGPAAHIAMMEAEIVTKRKWIGMDHFLDLVGATHLIPGPNSTEMTMHCGHERGGVTGLFVAGICFIFPAVVLTGILAFLYTEYGSFPEVQPFIFGIKPVVLAIIASAIYKLGKKALKNSELGALGVLVIVLSLLGVNEIMAFLGTGLIGSLYFSAKNGGKEDVSRLSLLVALQSASTGIVKVGSTKVFFTFLKVGAILYGSGYVLFAYLDAELVSTGIMSRGELLDAIAVGQLTPGPVLSTATFIGYQIGGFWGAMAATLGIFIPSFFFVLILNPLIPKMRQSKFLGYFLDSINVAAVGLMVFVLWKMGKETLISWEAILVAVLGFGLTFGFKKLNPGWIVLAGSLLGYFLTRFF